MSSKDNALFEVRKHNDFSVLCSDDEELETRVTETVAPSAAAINVVQHASDNDEMAADGFETFTTVRKVKRVTKPAPLTPSTASAPRPMMAQKPKEIVVPKVENSIELFEFPSTVKTADLRKFLHPFDGHYRLKWINDTSCYVVFDDEALGTNLLL